MTSKKSILISGGMFMILGD